MNTSDFDDDDLNLPDPEEVQKPSPPGDLDLDNLEIEILDEQDNLDASDPDNLESGDDPDDEGEREPSPPRQGRRPPSRAEKRIKELNRRAKEAERRAEEAEQRAQQALQEREKEHQRANASQVQAVRNFEHSLNMREQTLQKEWQVAQQDGDSEKMWSIQGELSDLKARKLQLDGFKRQIGFKPDGTYENPSPPAEAPRKTQQVDINNLSIQQVDMLIKQTEANDPRAGRWFRQNKDWFFANKNMRDTALLINEVLVKEEGYDPNGEDYYPELNRRIAEAFPGYFSRRKTPVRSPVGGGARDSSGAGVRTAGGKFKVTLTREEKEQAARLGVSLEDWARQKAKMAAESNL